MSAKMLHLRSVLVRSKSHPKLNESIFPVGVADSKRYMTGLFSRSSSKFRDYQPSYYGQNIITVAGGNGKTTKFMSKEIPNINQTFTRNGRSNWVFYKVPKPIMPVPGFEPDLEERKKFASEPDPLMQRPIDIGLPASKYASVEDSDLTRLDKLKYVKKIRTEELERSARNQTLMLNLNDVNSSWIKSSGLNHVKTIAEHYGVFRDLYGGSYYFLPLIHMDISFNLAGTRVYHGNIILPSEAVDAPTVEFQSEPDSLWTLVLTNLDGHFKQLDKEYVHWLVGNIPGCDIAKGETVVDYLRPFPAQGTGYHRLVFVLYKQDGKIDFSPIKRKQPCLSLADRTFSSLDFYSSHQDVMTPGGLTFFQSKWDKSLTPFFHNTLEMREPIFKHEFDPLPLQSSRQHPYNRAFNLFIDRYRDPKDLAEEVFLERLKNIHPFRPEPEPFPYPNAFPIDNTLPSWLRTEIEKKRKKIGKWKDL